MLDRLLFNVLWTVWMVAGTRWEEKDLAGEFGDDYRSYQRTVPMLLPWRGPAGRGLADGAATAKPT
jgi:protein-S-isoprenylcysteine O-methyltransferase Ste14